MTDADLLADRRRLRRKLSFWRVLAILIAIVGVVGAGIYAQGDRLGIGQQHIARIGVRGFIAGDQSTLRMIDRIAESDQVRGVFITIDSPGGTTSGAESLYLAIKKLAEKKPTVAVISGTAASGGYIVALSTNYIVARETSLVGSIGVLFQYPNLAGLLETLGVKVEEVKSSPLKASPNGFEPTSPEARAALQALVADSYAWFRGLVQNGRKLSEAELNVVSDGRVFTGRQAKPLKLVDELGGEENAMAWLKAQGKIQDDLPVRDWRPRGESSATTLWTGASALAEAFGFRDVAAAFRRAGEANDALRLDGLLAVWHPSLEK